MLIHQGLKFGVVGVAATATHFLVMLFVVELLHIDPVVATVPAFMVAFLVSYGLNYAWTFRATGAHRQLVGRYLAVALTGMCANALIMYICVHVLDWTYLLGFAIGVVVVPLLTFSGARWLVFRPHSKK